MNLKHKDYKLVFIYINDSQKRRLESYLDEMKYIFYSVQDGLEGVWGENKKHKNTKIWPGKECLFRILLQEKYLEKFLGEMRCFRLTIPDSVIMAGTVLPLDALIIDFKNLDVEYDCETLDILKNKHKR